MSNKPATIPSNVGRATEIVLEDLPLGEAKPGSLLESLPLATTKRVVVRQTKTRVCECGFPGCTIGPFTYSYA